MKKIKRFVSKIDTVDIVLLSAMGLYIGLLINSLLHVIL
jgi:hypothetical protein